MTRYGMKEEDMQELAVLIKDALKGKLVKSQITNLRKRFTKVHFS